VPKKIEMPDCEDDSDDSHMQHHHMEEDLKHEIQDTEAFQHHYLQEEESN